MNVSVENKSCIGFEVRIGGIDEGQTPTSRLPYYTKTAEHVINRMNDYYDTNGLSWKFAEDDEDEIEVIIEACWPVNVNVPEDDEITDNVERWLKEVI